MQITRRSLSNAVRASQKGATGVLMMNMGGPSTLAHVHSFLLNLFSDRDLIKLPISQKWAAEFIAKRRTPKIVEQYAKIGGGSPILRWTTIQGNAMVKLLDEISPETAPHIPFVAFRYVDPLTTQALTQMYDARITRAVAFSQYPQYSCTTTGSSLNELHKQITAFPIEKQQKMHWSVLDRWPTHPGLVNAICENIVTALLKHPPAERSSIPLIFSAHSLPLSTVDKGDPYPAEVAATVAAVIAALKQHTGFDLPYRLVWQSQVGPSRWLGPQTSDTIKNLARQGHKRAVTVPIAFVSDHIETLYELDLELAHEAREAGIIVHRAPSLNDNPTFIRALADLTHAHLKSVYPSLFTGSTEAAPSGYLGGRVDGNTTSVQMALRCPGCVNPKCEQSKQWFASGQTAST